MPTEEAATAEQAPDAKQGNDNPEGARKEAPSGEAPLGEAGEKALNAFKQRARDAEGQAKELARRVAELEDRDKSELEKLTGKLTKAEQAKAEAEAKLLRYEVAAEKQVPADALDLLTGSNREELEAKADKLLELTEKARAATTPDFDGGAREPAENTDPLQGHNDVILKLAGLKS